MTKYICVHGHFYQPPRENPWLEAVELQDSAHPFHDWNERITAECYAPNAYARLLDGDGRIREIVNNYASISFNVGPTLLTWLKEKVPDVHEAITEGDRESRQRFGGHGSALAQCYNHVIMPLASPRDKRTQALWGIRDFESRFGRAPEGMWQAECAVDHDTLDVLAGLGIRFTILSPYQASRVRPLHGGAWRDVNGGRIDPRRPYLVRLDSGRHIAVFFYHGHISRAVAFEHLLTDGGRFANRLLGAFDEGAADDQLVHIATDGESYGHHFRHGDMALAYALHVIEAHGRARLTNYAQYLAAHPPAHEVEIHQPSAWSCAHGVDRWRSDCGCNSGGRPAWNQPWRRPLREAFDWLRDQLAPLYERHASEYLADPWLARDDYIAVILDRAPASLGQFFARHARRLVDGEDQVEALRLLELQRHAMLMYTSCGWFFDDLSGIETVQVVQYAARAIQLARELTGTDLEPAFLERLARAHSNVPEHGDGRSVYERFVKPAIMDREKVGAHYAVSSVFETYPRKARIYSFTVEQEDHQVLIAGRTRLVTGRANVVFEITGKLDVITYAVLHLGDHTLNCGVRHYQGPEAYGLAVRQLREAFARADYAHVIRLMDGHFGESHYSLRNLFRDEQRKVLHEILAGAREDACSTYRGVADRYGPLLRFLADLPAPAPAILRIASEVVLNDDLRRQFEADAIDVGRVRALLVEARETHATLDVDTLGYVVKAHLEARSQALAERTDITALRSVLESASLLSALPFQVNLWKPQNVYFTLKRGALADMKARARVGDDGAREWVEMFRVLGVHLRFAIDQADVGDPAPSA